MIGEGEVADDAGVVLDVTITATIIVIVVTTTTINITTTNHITTTTLIPYPLYHP
jgi:hypothetical protein